MANAPPPTVQALLVCDHLYQDQSTRKMVIAGTFTRITARSYPAQHVTWFVYARLVDFQGEAKIRLRVVDLQDESVVGTLGPMTFRIEDRVNGHEFGVKMPPLPLPHTGAYAVDLLWGEDDVPLRSWRFVADQMEKPNA